MGARTRRARQGSWWEPLVPQVFRGLRSHHASVTAAVAAFLLVFYCASLFTPQSSALDLWLWGLRAAAALAVLLAVGLLRDKFPLWVAYLGALGETAAFIYFVGFSDDYQRILFRMQEFPLIAMYLSWLFPSWLTLSTVYPALLFTIPYAVYIGPFAGSEHGPGLLNALGLMFFTVLGTSMGHYIRRRFAIYSERDALTGALNRRGLQVAGEPLLSRQQRAGRPVSFVLLDLDGF